MNRRTALQLLSGGIAAGSLARTLPAAAAGARTRSAMPQAAAPPEQGATSLDLGWRFQRGDVSVPPLREQSESYMAAKAGGARGAASITYNDADWRVVDLPHDWAIEEPPVETANIAQGYRKRGIGWYRRALRLDPALEGRYLEIRFGAIATNATVWFNGSPVAHNWSGYNGFSIDITALAKFGDAPNVLAVRVDADAAEGWWYEGAGIYRDVWLIDRAPVSIATDGIHADPRQDADGTWRVPVEATLYSIEKAPTAVTIVTELLDPSGSVVGSARGEGRTIPLGQAQVRAEIAAINPQLWSVEQPHLYSVRTRLLRDGKPIDERITPCGFRAIRFDAQRGFFLNDRPTKIKGVCLHQDHAGVGVAVPPALVDWRVRQLKAMGCNAIRCSHGAPDKSLLEVCDRLGMLVMDENRNFNVSPDYLEQLEWLIRRDRNHPSVILWSVFNEEPLQGTPVGYEMVRRATAAVKALDDSRPITAALSNGMFTPVNVSQAVDVVGFNYQHASYDRFHKEHPDTPMLSSEDTSAFMTRGAWATDKAKHVESSGDTERAGWGLTQRASWKAIDSRPFVAGGFVWTGFDYHGEPTPFKWPSNSSYFGILDLCGFPKAAFYLRRAMWVKDRPLLDILPHWNWAGQEGKPIKVLIATNLDRVELRCNGITVGDGKPDPYEMISFDVPYAAGVLEARGWQAGKLVASDRVETTGPPVRLRLTVDRKGMAGDGVDAQPITIEAIDSRGRPVPTDEADVALTIAGGRIIGVGNGDPTALAPSKGDRVRLFNGLAQVIVQSERGTSGALALVARSSGLAQGNVRIAVAPAARRELLPLGSQQSLPLWRQSPVVAQRPQSIPDLADNDMNSWDQVIAGERPQPAATAGYVMIVTRLSLSGASAQGSARLRFASLSGAGEVLADGILLGKKSDAAPAALVVDLPPGKPSLTIAVVLHAAAGEAVGLAGPVFVEPKGVK